MQIKSYQIYWTSSIIVSLITFIDRENPIDIPLHDTYYVIHSIVFAAFFSGLLAILGFGYWLVRRRILRKWMTILHTVPTILFSLIACNLNLFFKPFASKQIANNIAINGFSILFLITIIAQVIFIVNLSISKKKITIEYHIIYPIVIII